MHKRAWRSHSSPARAPIRLQVCSLFPIILSPPRCICWGSMKAQVALTHTHVETHTHTHTFLKISTFSARGPSFPGRRLKSRPLPGLRDVKRGAWTGRWWGGGLECDGHAGVGEWLCPVSLWLVFCSNLLGALLWTCGRCFCSECHVRNKRFSGEKKKKMKWK